MELKQNLDTTGRSIRAGIGLSLLGLAMFPPDTMRTSKQVTLLATLGTLSLAEAALGYCVCKDAGLTRL